MVQGDMNCISGQSTNKFSFSGDQQSRFHKSHHQMHQMHDTRMQNNQFLLGQHLIHPQVYLGMTPVYFPIPLHTTVNTSIDEKHSINQLGNSVKYCIFVMFFFCLLYVTSSLMKKGSIMHHRNL